jgi:2'-5' RNA ligase
MRVFIAIDFDKTIKTYLENIKNKLENYCIKGSFTRSDNFHLTLQFIGEFKELNITKLVNALEECVLKQPVFSLTLNKLGSFKKGDSHILWIGLNYSEELVRVYKELAHTLKHENIAFDEKPLKPHITIGRRVVFRKDAYEIQNLVAIDNLIIPVANITLMESKQVDGKLTYIPLATFSLLKE